MKAEKYAITGGKKIDIHKLPTNSKKDEVDKEDIIAKYEANKAELALLQDRFYADGREGIILVLQALDASGKDSAVKNIFSGIKSAGSEDTFIQSAEFRRTLPRLPLEDTSERAETRRNSCIQPQSL